MIATTTASLHCQLSRLLLLALPLLIIAGCDWWRPSPGRGSGAFSVFRDPAVESIGRVVVMPMSRGPGVGDSAQAIDTSLPRSLRELNRFEVITATSEDRDRLLGQDPLRGNRVAPDALREVRSTFGADAVLIGRIDHWQSYDPLAAGLTAHLVDCRTGAVLWSATGEWDSANHSIQADIRAWYYHRRGVANEPLSGWESVLNSPSAFARYISDRLAGSVPDPDPQPRR